MMRLGRRAALLGAFSLLTSAYLLRPLTRQARVWITEHLPEDATWWCGAVVVEHRYIGPIVGGAIGDDLVVR